MRQLQLSEIQPHKDDDWMYRPILKGAFSTRTTYDSDGIQMEHLEEFEAMRE